MADEIIIDDYQLLNHISTGSSTQVWEATDKGGGGERRYAMKVMLPEALAQSEFRSVLKHEAKLAERFEHPNIVRFYKLVLNKKRGYILMDYFRAPNLKVQIQSELVSVQARIARLVEQLCQVLGYLHGQGWVHRDIKPDNILFNKASELRLIDFSLTTRRGRRRRHDARGQRKGDPGDTDLHTPRGDPQEADHAAIGYLQPGRHSV